MSTSNTLPETGTRDAVAIPAQITQHDPLSSVLPKTGSKRKVGPSTARKLSSKKTPKKDTDAPLSDLQSTPVSFTFESPIESARLRLNKTVVQPQEESLYTRAKKVAKIQLATPSEQSTKTHSSYPSLLSSAEPLQKSEPIKVFSVAKIKPHIYDTNGRLLSQTPSASPNAQESIAHNLLMSQPKESVEETTQASVLDDMVIKPQEPVLPIEMPQETPEHNTAIQISANVQQNTTLQMQMPVMQPTINVVAPEEPNPAEKPAEHPAPLMHKKQTTSKVHTKSISKSIVSFLEATYDELSPSVGFFIKSVPQMVNGLTHIIAPTMLLVAVMFLFPTFTALLFNSHPAINFIKLAVAWAISAFFWSLGVLLFLKTKSVLKQKILLWNKKGSTYVKHYDK